MAQSATVAVEGTWTGRMSPGGIFIGCGGWVRDMEKTVVSSDFWNCLECSAGIKVGKTGIR